MSEPTCFTYELTNDQQELLLGLMVNGNYRRREVPYALWSIEGDHFNATLYAKEKHGRRKFCVQGRGAGDFVLYTLEPQVLKTAELGYEEVLHPELFSAHAGSDESGKGDYFGPLVVCCAYTDEELSAKMRELGVRDCKQMSDSAVLSVGAELRRLLGAEGYNVVQLNPPAYNRLYAKIRNINRLLAWAHGAAIEGLLERRPACSRVVVDQFAPTELTIRRALKTRGRQAQVEQRHKAESDIAVAAASVIARELFIRATRSAGEHAGEGGAAVEIPLGSSSPEVARLAAEMVGRHGPSWLMNNCKTHFQTTDKVLASCGLSRADLPPEGQVTSRAKAGSDAVPQPENPN